MIDPVTHTTSLHPVAKNHKNECYFSVSMKHQQLFQDYKMNLFISDNSKIQLGCGSIFHLNVDQHYYYVPYSSDFRENKDYKDSPYYCIFFSTPSRENGLFMLQTLISSDEFNVSDVEVVWYKNGTHKTGRLPSKTTLTSEV